MNSMFRFFRNLGLFLFFVNFLFQLLGMPQTVIPVAIHPTMQNQFPVRPLMVDHSPDGRTSSSAHQQQRQNHLSLPKRIALTTDTPCGGGQHQHLKDFHLPIALRPSVVLPSVSQQQTTEKYRICNKIWVDLDLFNYSFSFFPKIFIPSSTVSTKDHQQQRSTTSSSERNPATVSISQIDQTGAEPLDLSTSKRENNGKSGGNRTEVANQQQRRKRTLVKGQEEPGGGKRNRVAVARTTMNVVEVRGGGGGLIH